MRRQPLIVRAVAAEAALLSAGLLVLVLAPVRPPSRHLPTITACAAGAGGGLLLFAVLARTLRPPRLDLALARTVPLLLARAGAEECLWRWGLLLGLAPALGAAGATTLSSAAFAAAHGLRQTRRELALRSGIGATFALLFVTTGRLVAAITAHAVYNTLVCGASSPSREPS